MTDDFYKRKFIYCGNCGKRGHIYKNCFKPIISLGIVCFQFNNLDINQIIEGNEDIINFYQKTSFDPKIITYIKKNLKFLLVKRKHSLGYIEFTRGNYNLENEYDIRKLKNIFNIMIEKERKFIKNSDFDALWNNLWILKESTNSHKNEYEKAKMKYEKIKNGFKLNNTTVSLTSIIKETDSSWTEAEWGFPKGRRNIKESDLHCANREFMEETGFKNNEYSLVNLSPTNEVFMGSNNLHYQHIYYISKSFKEDIPIINKNNFYQIIEIGDIGWFSFDEAINKIRKYNTERRLVLKKINYILTNIIASKLSK